jgi:hypothetical protein
MIGGYRPKTPNDKRPVATRTGLQSSLATSRGYVSGLALPRLANRVEHNHGDFARLRQTLVFGIGRPEF